MKNIISKKVWVLLFAMFFLGSCSDILDYDDPNHKNTDSYFNKPEEINQAAIAIYSAFHYNSMFGWRWPEMFDALANEFDGKPAALANEANIAAIQNYQFNNTNDAVSGYWKLLYRMILRSNLVIYKGEEYLTNNSASEVVSKSLGDAYFLRGWAYTQLAFYWGRVPLRLSYVDEGNGDAPRASKAEEVWAVAETDLKKAQTLLPDTWDAPNLGRATKGAATGFLGKLYLYNKKYTEAEAEFAKLEGKYTLLAANQWLDNFGETNENNSESVFEIQFEAYAGTNRGTAGFGEPETTSGQPGRETLHAQLYSWTDWSNWAFQPRRVKDFQYQSETETAYIDPRAALTFYGGIGDQTYCDNCTEGVKPFDFKQFGYWYKKYTNKENKPSENTAETSNNWRLLRYADILLMRAECKLNGAATDIPGSMELINQVRRRIGAFEYKKVYSKEQAFELLKRERQLEFMGEQVRFNDLKRWGILKETMNIETQALFGKNAVEDKHYFFPIPQVEIDSNIGLGPVANNWN